MRSGRRQIGSGSWCQRSRSSRRQTGSWCPGSRSSRRHVGSEHIIPYKASCPSAGVGGTKVAFVWSDSRGRGQCRHRHRGKMRLGRSQFDGGSWCQRSRSSRRQLASWCLGSRTSRRQVGSEQFIPCKASCPSAAVGGTKVAFVWSDSRGRGHCRHRHHGKMRSGRRQIGNGSWCPGSRSSRRRIRSWCPGSRSSRRQVGSEHVIPYKARYPSAAVGGTKVAFVWSDSRGRGQCRHRHHGKMRSGRRQLGSGSWCQCSRSSRRQCSRRQVGSGRGIYPHAPRIEGHTRTRTLASCVTFLNNVSAEVTRQRKKRSCNILRRFHPSQTPSSSPWSSHPSHVVICSLAPFSLRQSYIVRQDMIDVESKYSEAKHKIITRTFEGQLEGLLSTYLARPSKMKQTHCLFPR